MRDKDTKILEERYIKVLKEANTAVFNTIIQMTRGDELYEDVPLAVEYETYKGSSAFDDPSDTKIISAEVSNNVIDENGNVVIKAGTSLKQLRDFTFNPDKVKEDLNEYITHDAGGLPKRPNYNSRYKFY